MYNAFSLKDADFTGLKEGGEIFINSVNHKTYLKVFEDGCQAAAISDIEIKKHQIYLIKKKKYTI